MTGRVVPMHEGVVVRVEGRDGLAKLDAEGNFAFAELPAGPYTLTIESPRYSTRRIRDILVREDVTVVLGELRLSTLPAPFFESSVDSGATNIDLGTREMDFYSDESIALTELNNATTIDPPIQFRWYPGSYDRVGWSYSYTLYLFWGQLRVGTEYTVTIDRSLTTESGMSMDRDLTVTFATIDSLELSVWAEEGTLPPYIRLRDFKLYLEINGEAHLDSLDTAVTIDPTLPGAWVYLLQHGPVFTYKYRLDAPVVADVAYTLRVDSSVPLIDSLHLAEDVVYEFHTEPRRVLDVFPKDGDVHRTTDIWNMSLTFNLPVDTTTVSAGVTITTGDGATLPGYFAFVNSGYTVGFVPFVGPESGQHYFIHVGPELRFIDGGSLKEPFESGFSVQ